LSKEVNVLNIQNKAYCGFGAGIIFSFIVLIIALAGSLYYNISTTWFTQNIVFIVFLIMVLGILGAIINLIPYSIKLIKAN
jgi:hypothetical protein